MFWFWFFVGFGVAYLCVGVFMVGVIQAISRDMANRDAPARIFLLTILWLPVLVARHIRALWK